jgi:hypothetical protein
MSLSSLLIYIDRKYQRRRIGKFFRKLQIFAENTVKGFMRLPSGQSIREAIFKVLETGPLHNFLGKRVK